jgi:hypothetical protein
MIGNERFGIRLLNVCGGTSKVDSMPDLRVEHLDPRMRFVVYQAGGKTKGQGRHRERVGAVTTDTLL